MEECPPQGERDQLQSFSPPFHLQKKRSRQKQKNHEAIRFPFDKRNRSFSFENRETDSLGPVITVTAQWSDHGLGEPKKSSEEETHTLGDSQRTTMQEYLLKLSPLSIV